MIEKCDNCYWYWTEEYNCECHRPDEDGDGYIIRARSPDDVCGYYTPKIVQDGYDSFFEYQQYQNEWN